VPRLIKQVEQNDERALKMDLARGARMACAGRGDDCGEETVRKLEVNFFWVFLKFL